MLIKKKSKCCQWFCLQASILCEAALSRSHCLQNGVGERYWEQPSSGSHSAIQSEGKTCSFLSPSMIYTVGSWCLCPGSSICTWVWFARHWDPAIWHIYGALPFPWPSAHLSWAEDGVLGASPPQPWCLSPASTLRESCKDWSRDIPSSAHQV